MFRSVNVNVFSDLYAYERYFAISTSSSRGGAYQEANKNRGSELQYAKLQRCQFLRNGDCKALEASLTKVIAIQTHRTTQRRGAMEYILHTKKACTSDVTDHLVSHALIPAHMA